MNIGSSLGMIALSSMIIAQSMALFARKTDLIAQSIKQIARKSGKIARSSISLEYLAAESKIQMHESLHYVKNPPA